MESRERRGETLEEVKRNGLKKDDKGTNYNSGIQDNHNDSSEGLGKSKDLGEEDQSGKGKKIDSSKRVGEIDQNVLSGLMTLCEKAAMIEEEEDGDVEFVSGEHEGGNLFCVGDFVWGKIKHHPWWPGQIYDPSDASDLALKIPQKDRYLVAYFGDGTFSWCYGSQLKPFEENFEQFSKESSAKGFLNAVDAALEMVGRLLELRMSWSSVAGHVDEMRLIIPVAGNAGIKEGVIVPQNGISKLSITQFEPRKIVARLKCLGQVTGELNLLELTVLKSMLSAFYRAKGYTKLPAYHFPQNIVGLEDKNKGVAEDNGESFEGLPLQNRPVLSDDKLYHRRKQKSMAEILATETGAVLKRHKDETDSGKSVSEDRKGKNVADDNSDDKLISLSMSRKRHKFSKGIVITDSKPAPDVEVVKIDLNIVSGDGKEEEVCTVQNEEEPQVVQSPRERKKSKYLSPPYTLPKRGGRDSELEFLKVIYSGDAHVGERLTKAANTIMGSPSSRKVTNDAFQIKDSEEDSDKNDKPELSSPQIASQKPILDKVNVNEVLSGIQSAALGLPPKSLDGSEEFFNSYRDSLCHNGSNYNMASKGKPGRKKKSAEAESGALGKGMQQLNNISSQSKTQVVNNEVNGEKSVTPKLKRKHARSGANQTESEPHRKRIKKTEEKPITPVPKEASSDQPIVKQAEKSARKRKKDNAEKEYLSPENESDKRSLKQNEDKVSAPDSKQMPAVSGEKQSERKPRGKRIKKGEAKHETPKPEQPVDSAVKPKKVKKKNDGEALSAAVVLTFQSRVPTKSDLIADYSKFGPLNEERTEILDNYFHARVVFKKKSDGEKAFKHLMKLDTQDSGITYALQYVPSDSRPHPSDSLQGKENDKSPENTSSVQYITQKLDMLTSMVKNSEGTMSQEMKTNLENEMKDLLEKVRNMATSSTA